MDTLMNMLFQTDPELEDFETDYEKAQYLQQILVNRATMGLARMSTIRSYVSSF